MTARGWIIALVAGLTAGAAQAGTIEGQISLEIEGVRLADLGPTVAFLSGGPQDESPPATAEILQSNANFVPGFLVVSVGQEVSMPNLDTIFHNVFSFSEMNRFDLGLYPKGETRSVRLNHAGIVRIYCSIHESMSGSILVTPTPHHTRVDSRGHFSIRDVPAGDYEVSIWNERLPPTTRPLSITGRETVRVDIAIGSTKR